MVHEVLFWFLILLIIDNNNVSVLSVPYVRTDNNYFGFGSIANFFLLGKKAVHSVDRMFSK